MVQELLDEAVQTFQCGELPVTLAQQESTIYLSAVHLIDIKAALAAKADRAPEVGDEHVAQMSCSCDALSRSTDKIMVADRAVASLIVDPQTMSVRQLIGSGRNWNQFAN